MSIDFLLENGGPSIRYRTKKELLHSTNPIELESLRNDVLKTDKVQSLLDKLLDASKLYRLNQLHGAKTIHLENILPILLDYGVNAEFDLEKYDFNNILDRIAFTEYDKDYPFCDFSRIIIYPYLSRFGIKSIEMTAYMLNRLNVIHNFVLNESYDIFADQSTYKGIPNNFKNHKVILPEFYENGVIQFPLIYDIYMLAELYGSMTIDI